MVKSGQLHALVTLCPAEEPPAPSELEEGRALGLVWNLQRETSLVPAWNQTRTPQSPRLYPTSLYLLTNTQQQSSAQHTRFLEIP